MSIDLERIRDDIIRIAASCVRMQNIEPEDITADDMRAIGQHGRDLCRIYEELRGES